MASSQSAKKFEIEELNLINFGKFKDLKINFASGLNLIYGKNESGKSTIQLFIKAMLYGLPTRKKSGEYLKERDRAIPWTSNRAEGAMKINVEGRSMEIRRRFGKTAAGDKLEVCDSLSGEIIEGFADGNVGEVLLGIPCGVFEKTVWIRQGAVPIDGSDDEMSARLMNLKSSGDESVSADSALAVLAKEKRLLKARDGRSAAGRIDVLTDRREDCKRKKYDLATQLAQTERTKERLNLAYAEQSKLAAEIERGENEYKKSVEATKAASMRERLRRIDECNRKLEEIYNNSEYKKALKITDEDTQTAFALEAKLGQLRQSSVSEKDFKAEEAELLQKSSKASMLKGGGIVLSVIMLAAAVAAFAFSQILLAVCALVLAFSGAAVFISGIRTDHLCKTIRSRIESEKQTLQSAADKKEKEFNDIKNQYDNIISRFGASDASDLQRMQSIAKGQTEIAESLEKAKKGFLGEDSYEDLKAACGSQTELPKASAAEIEQNLSQMRRRQMELVSEIKELESKMAYEVKIDGLPADIDTEIRAIESEIMSCERRLRVIELAEAAIREASEAWRRGFTPALNERVNEIIGHLTDGRYKHVRVSEDYRMRVEADSSLVDAEYFSYGTYEQIYFALRVASAELICGNVPMFLDDILTAYDSERALNALKFLDVEAEQKQIMLFTCHEADKENVEPMGVHTININNL